MLQRIGSELLIGGGIVGALTIGIADANGYKIPSWGWPLVTLSFLFGVLFLVLPRVADDRRQRSLVPDAKQPLANLEIEYTSGATFLRPLKDKGWDEPQARHFHLETRLTNRSQTERLSLGFTLRLDIEDQPSRRVRERAFREWKEEETTRTYLKEPLNLAPGETAEGTILFIVLPPHGETAEWHDATAAVLEIEDYLSHETLDVHTNFDPDHFDPVAERARLVKKLEHYRQLGVVQQIQFGMHGTEPPYQFVDEQTTEYLNRSHEVEALLEKKLGLRWVRKYNNHDGLIADVDKYPPGPMLDLAKQVDFSQQRLRTIIDELEEG